MEIINSENVQVIKLEIEIEHTGHITNTYIIKDKKTRDICVVDPAYGKEQILQEIFNLNGNFSKVIITHSHADHIACLAGLVENKDVEVYIYDLDYDGLYNKVLNEEDVVKTKVLPVDKQKVTKVQDKNEIQIGSIKLEVIHTPGHTKGSMVLVDRMNNILYSGDTIFENSYGRTDLITGDHESMKQTLERLCNEFDDILVLPGHGRIFNFKDSKRKIRLLFAYKG